MSPTTRKLTLEDLERVVCGVAAHDIKITAESVSDSQAFSKAAGEG